jgi:hypothetical protein
MLHCPCSHKHKHKHEDKHTRPRSRPPLPHLSCGERRRRLTPQPTKIRADVEMTCFNYDGVEHIKTAMRAVQASSTEDMEIKMKLVRRGGGVMQYIIWSDGGLTLLLFVWPARPVASPHPPTHPGCAHVCAGCAPALCAHYHDAGQGCWHRSAQRRA